MARLVAMLRFAGSLGLSAALLCALLALARPQGATRVMLVQLNADGADTFGCGDRVVAVPLAVAKDADPLQVALEALLSRGAELARRHGLYSALALSDLRVGELIIENRAVTVVLTGELRLADDCDATRVREQLQRTVLQYREFRSARFVLDGIDLEELLDPRP